MEGHVMVHFFLKLFYFMDDGVNYMEKLKFYLLLKTFSNI